MKIDYYLTEDNEHAHTVPLIMLEIQKTVDNKCIILYPFLKDFSYGQPIGY